MPAGPFAMAQFAGMGPMGGMAGMGGMPAPYMMMPQMGSYPPAAAFGFPGGAMGAHGYAHGGSGSRGGGSGMQPSAFAQQQVQQHGVPPGQQQQAQQQYPRPLRMASRNGSRGTIKVDSASSLEHSSGEPAPASTASVAAVQDQLGKMGLAG